MTSKSLLSIDPQKSNRHHRASADNILIWAPRADPAKVSPGLAASVPSTAELGSQTTGLWSTLWSTVGQSIVEGFALYAAAMYPGALLEDEYRGTEPPINAPNGGAFKAGSARSNASEPARPGPRRHPTFIVTPQRRTMWGSSLRNPVATLWAHWRRERDIKKAVAALERCDDRVLRGMGILDRTGIERVVRYCRNG